MSRVVEKSLGACLAFHCSLPKPAATTMGSFNQARPSLTFSPLATSFWPVYSRTAPCARHAGGQVLGTRGFHATSASESDSAAELPPPTFAAHLKQGQIVNPFPGMPTLEAAIGRTVTARIGSNECIPMGDEHPLSQYLPPELVDLARLYPDPYARRIRAQLAEMSGVPEKELIIDAGADSLISLTLRTRVVAGDKVVTTAGTYPTVVYFAKGLGAEVVEVPYKDDGKHIIPDLVALAKAAQEHAAAVVYLANPDNPTGHVFDPSDILELRHALPAETVLILDEAYIDFCPDKGLWHRMHNTVQTRTLSKAYGLAGLRLGYAIADRRWVEKADQIRVQFTMNSLSNFLIEHVLADPAFKPRLLARTQALMDQLAQELAAGSAPVLPSATNFVTVRYASAEDAQSRQKDLWKLGAAVHRPPHPAMGHVLRITASPQSLDPATIDILTRP